MKILYGVYDVAITRGNGKVEIIEDFKSFDFKKEKDFVLISVNFHGTPIWLRRDVDSIGETTYDIEYKDNGAFFHEILSISEMVMFAAGVNNALLLHNPNLEGAEFE